MKRFLILFTAFIFVFGMIGCSDDDDPPTGGGNNNTATSTWMAAEGHWSTSIDATSADDFTAFSFTSKDTVNNSGAKPLATGWDVAFRREVVKTNGGSSTNNNGDVEAVSLGVVNFDAVTISDTTGVEWVSDHIDYFIDQWMAYNFVTHQIEITRNVYSMLDASGEHYVKFQIDSMVGAAQPPDMGTIYMKYFYQSTVDSKDLSGQTVEVSFTVGTNHVYFDFSSGTVVTPSDPANDLGWDLGFYSYDICQNSGPNGIGECAAFLAFGELIDPTDIDGFMQQPTGAPMFPDIAGSAMTEWYSYTGPPLHQLPSKSEVYLLKTGDKVYKLRIESYYGEDGSAASGNYNFIWVEL